MVCGVQLVLEEVKIHHRRTAVATIRLGKAEIESLDFGLVPPSPVLGGSSHLTNLLAVLHGVGAVATAQRFMTCDDDTVTPERLNQALARHAVDTRAGKRGVPMKRQHPPTSKTKDVHSAPRRPLRPLYDPRL